MKYSVLNVEKALEATPKPSNSGSSGCNVGFGALALLFVLALPAAKKCGKKAD